MIGWRGVVICALCLYLAAAAEQSLSHWTMFGGRCDYLLLTMCVLCLFADRRGGAFIGFAAGWLMGALDGANMWQYVATRAVAGFLIAWIAESGIERNYFSTILSAVFAVLFCQLAIMFLAPPPSIMPFLGDTIRTAAYNGVLAVPLYAALNRILGPRP